LAPLQRIHFSPLEGNRLHADRIVKLIHLRGESNNRGETTMVYVKPQVNNVRNASLTIQGVKNITPYMDNDQSTPFHTSAAYEADE
jgi:hypothetical protein